MRIVSLVCSNTEIVHALGLGSLLVGVDDHSDFPPDTVDGLPRLGPELGIRVTELAELEPDLVLASLSVPGQERVVGALKETGLPLLVLDPLSVEDVYEDIGTVAEALGVPERGKTVVGEMKEALASVRSGAKALRDRMDPGDPRHTVLVQWWPKPVISPGRLSWAQDLLELVGVQNPLGGEEIRSRPISDDEVAKMAPDAIVISWCGVDPAQYRPEVVLGNPSWQEIPAIRAGHVYCVPEAYLGRPGPRLVEGARALLGVVAEMHAGA